MPWRAPKQLATELGYSVEHIRRMVRTGEWLTHQLPGGTGVRVRVDELGRPVPAPKKRGAAR